MRAALSGLMGRDLLGGATIDSRPHAAGFVRRLCELFAIEDTRVGHLNPIAEKDFRSLRLRSLSRARSGSIPGRYTVFENIAFSGAAGR
jgi:hypothetical protein